jgi:hypothetical protein
MAVRTMVTGLDSERVADVVLVVPEVAHETLRYTSGAGVLQVRDDGHELIMEITSRRGPQPRRHFCSGPRQPASLARGSLPCVDARVFGRAEIGSGLAAPAGRTHEA